MKMRKLDANDVTLRNPSDSSARSSNSIGMPLVRDRALSPRARLVTDGEPFILTDVAVYLDARKDEIT